MKHRKRRILSMLLLAAALIGTPAARAETLTCIVADGQYVNVRNRAASDAATWGILHTGDIIETNPAEIVGGFFKTTYKDRVAYVSVKYFEIAVDKQYEIEANGRVRVRKSPAGEAMGFIQPGETVYVIAWRYAPDGSRWAKCTGGRFISADYLKLVQQQ